MILCARRGQYRVLWASALAIPCRHEESSHI